MTHPSSTRTEFSQILTGASPADLIRDLNVITIILYAAGTEGRFIKRNKKKRIKIDEAQLRASEQWQPKIYISTEKISEITKTHCQGIGSSRTSVRKSLHFFIDIEVMKQNVNSFTPGEYGKVNPIYDIDLRRLAELAFCIEQELKFQGFDFRQNHFECEQVNAVDWKKKLLPAHNFAIAYLIGRALGMSWGRKTEEEELEEIERKPEPPAPEVTISFKELAQSVKKAFIPQYELDALPF